MASLEKFKSQAVTGNMFIVWVLDIVEARAIDKDLMADEYGARVAIDGAIHCNCGKCKVSAVIC